MHLLPILLAIHLSRWKKMVRDSFSFFLFFYFIFIYIKGIESSTLAIGIKITQCTVRTKRLLLQVYNASLYMDTTFLNKRSPPVVRHKWYNKSSISFLILSLKKKKKKKKSFLVKVTITSIIVYLKKKKRFLQ